MTPQNDLLSRHNYKVGRALIVGSKIYGDRPDRRKIYAESFGLDMQPGDGVDIVHDFEFPLPGNVGQFDHADCCSVLEHVKHPWLMAANIERCLVEEGTLIVSVPLVWRMHSYPGDYWRFTPDSLDVLFPNIKWDEKTIYCNKRIVERPPSFNTPDKTPWLARTEVVAFGVKCTLSC